MGSRYHGKANIRRTPKHLEEAYSRLSRWRRRKTAQLSEAQGHRCCYCCGPTYLCEMPPIGMTIKQQATLEHLTIQSSDCQTNLDINLVMACSECNNLRSERTPMKFYNRIRMKAISLPPPPLNEKQAAKKLKKEMRGILLCLTIVRHWPDLAQRMIEFADSLPVPKKNGERTRDFLNAIYERIQADPRIPA